MVANDIHPLRIESLKDAILRSGLSTTLTDRIIYTNHDASKFPTPKSGKLFDCILADVPCSGDGTIRKDPRILSGWMPSIGNSLHSVQKKILKRALRLVNIGGVVAYSTCSLNPIENEAVVASVLSDANDNGNQKNDDRRDSGVNKVELLEWPDHILSELKRSKGYSSWRVANYIEENEPEEEDGQTVVDDVPQLQWYDSFEDANRDRVPHVVESMWPPLDTKNINRMNLNRCIRLRPQDNDTGGFFVALLRRVS
jgi:16S rRNA C967 or C1407 C5-methylase (RsmB/RsmF family)